MDIIAWVEADCDRVLVIDIQTNSDADFWHHWLIGSILKLSKVLFKSWRTSIFLSNLYYIIDIFSPSVGFRRVNSSIVKCQLEAVKHVIMTWVAEEERIIFRENDFHILQHRLCIKRWAVMFIAKLCIHVPTHHYIYACPTTSFHDLCQFLHGLYLHIAGEICQDEKLILQTSIAPKRLI